MLRLGLRKILGYQSLEPRQVPDVSEVRICEIPLLVQKPELECTLDVIDRDVHTTCVRLLG